MATAPVKSQPLHNFSFPFLKWGAHSNGTDHRGDSPEKEAEADPLRPTRVGSRSTRTQRLSFSARPIKQHRQQEQQEEEALVEVELETASKNPRQEHVGLASKRQKHAAAAAEKENNETEEEEEEHEEETVQRPWNLRPRKTDVMVALAMEKQTESTAMAPKSVRLRGLAENGGAVERKEKRKFWIALSREEIEEDVFVMTGSRPARRPKKRPKNVQKVLDSVFPGLWLVGTSADAYRVADSPVKK